MSNYLNILVYWTAEERAIMEQEFKINLKDGILPSLVQCEEVRKKHKILQRRNAPTMKAWINNSLKKKKICQSKGDNVQ